MKRATGKLQNILKQKEPSKYYLYLEILTMFGLDSIEIRNPPAEEKDQYAGVK